MFLGVSEQEFQMFAKRRKRIGELAEILSGFKALKQRSYDNSCYKFRWNQAAFFPKLRNSRAEQIETLLWRSGDKGKSSLLSTHRRPSLRAVVGGGRLSGQSSSPSVAGGEP
jgi:hypothetical protein